MEGGTHRLRAVSRSSVATPSRRCPGWTHTARTPQAALTRSLWQRRTPREGRSIRAKVGVEFKGVRWS